MTTTLIESLDTPRYVAPPLSPANFGTQAGAHPKIFGSNCLSPAQWLVSPLAVTPGGRLPAAVPVPPVPVVPTPPVPAVPVSVAAPVPLSTLLLSPADTELRFERPPVAAETSSPGAVDGTTEMLKSWMPT